MDSAVLQTAAQARVRRWFSALAPEARRALISPQNRRIRAAKTSRLKRGNDWYSWSQPGIVAVFFRTIPPVPGLLTTDATVRALFDISGANNFFASNRFEGGGFIVRPTASFFLLNHLQVNGNSRYAIPLAFVLGVPLDGEDEAVFVSRLESLLAHTLNFERQVATAK